MRPRTWSRPARRGVRGGLLVAAAATVGAVSLGTAALVAGETPGDGWDVAPVLGAVVTGAVAWPVARRRTDATADRLVKGTRTSAAEVARTFDEASDGDLPVDELLVVLAESLVRSFGAATAEVWRIEHGRLVRRAAVPGRPDAAIALDPAAARVLAGGGVVGPAWLDLWLPVLRDEILPHHGTPPRDGDTATSADDGATSTTADGSRPEVRIVPASHGREVLGLVVLTRDPGAERFTSMDDEALAELGRRIGVVLHNRQLDAALQATLEDLRHRNDELRASRVRLVATADAERRRIERDLHDGAQQHLVALAVNLRLATDSIGDDPALAPQLLGALGDEVRAAIAELRSLAHGIFPPLLMDAGLTEALVVAGDRSPSRVTVRSGALGRYAPEVEAAVYFCCVEALQNAAKHAPDAAVTIDLDEAEGRIHFTVDDDGPGPGDATVTAGHGLANMTDRVGALGGSLTLGPAPSGGTRVSGVVPVEVPEAGEAR